MCFGVGISGLPIPKSIISFPLFLSFALSLFISPKSSYNRGIETISLAKGEKNCKPNGYTNVDGNLCLSKCQLKNLQTRGKNDPDAVIDFLK